MGGQGRVIARFRRALPWGRYARGRSTDRPGDKTPYHPRSSQTLQPKRSPSLRPGPWSAAAAAGAPVGPWPRGSPSAPPFCSLCHSSSACCCFLFRVSSAFRGQPLPRPSGRRFRLRRLLSSALTRPKLPPPAPPPGLRTFPRLARSDGTNHREY